MENFDFQQFVQWCFLAIIGGGIAFSAKFLCDLSRSVASLNASLKVVLTTLDWHEKELTRLDEQIDRLENHKVKGYDA